MTNFKKLLKINYGIGKGVFQGIFTMYIIAVGLVLLHSLLSTNPSLTASTLRGVFYIFSTISLLFTPLLQLDKKLLFSIPLNSLKSYCQSILICQLSILTAFYSIYFVFALIFSQSLFANGMIWILNILFITSILKVSYKSESVYSKEPKTYFVVIILIVVYSFFVTTNSTISKYTAEFVHYLKNHGISIDLVILGVLILLFIYKTIRLNNRVNTVELNGDVKNNLKKTKVEPKEVKYNKLSDFKLILKLKSWSSKNLASSITLGFFITLFLLQSIYFLDTIRNVFTAVLFIPFIFVILFDLPNIYDLTMGLPINIYKLYTKEKLIRLFIYLSANLMILIFFYYTNLTDDFNFIYYYLSSLVISLFIFAVYEFFLRLGTQAIFSIAILASFINPQKLVIFDLKVIFILLMIATGLYILTYFTLKKTLKNKGTVRILEIKVN